MVTAAVSARLVFDVLWSLDLPVMGWPLHHVGSGLALAVLALCILYRPPYLTRWERVVGAGWMLVVTIGWVRTGISVSTTIDLARLLAPLLVFGAVRGAGVTARQLVDGLLIAGVGPLLLALAAWGAGQPSEHVVHGYPRLMGAHANPHNLGLVCSLLTPLALWRSALHPPDRLRWRVGITLVLLIAVACMTATYVRTAWVWAFVSLFVALLQVQRRRAGGVFVLGVAGFLCIPSARARLAEVFQAFMGIPPEGGWAALGSWRLAIWQSVGAKFGALGGLGLLLGHGLGAHNTLHPKGLDPHMDLLSIAIQFGLVGVMIYGGTLWGLGRRCARHEDPFAPLVLGMTVALLVTSGLSNTILARPSIAWAYFGLAAALPVPRGPTLSGRVDPLDAGQGHRTGPPEPS